MQPRIGSTIATILFESYCKAFPEAFKKCVCESILNVDLFLDKNISVIANMGCFDIAKPIVNAFLRPSNIFFPAASINFIYIFCNIINMMFLLYIMYSYQQIFCV